MLLCEHWPIVSCGSARIICIAMCHYSFSGHQVAPMPGRLLLSLQINVNVTYGGPQFGRVVTANEAVTRGDLLASIPLDLAWNTATSGGNGSMQVSHCLAGSQTRSNFGASHPVIEKDAVVLMPAGPCPTHSYTVVTIYTSNP